MGGEGARAAGMEAPLRRPLVTPTEGVPTKHRCMEVLHSWIFNTHTKGAERKKLARRSVRLTGAEKEKSCTVRS